MSESVLFELLPGERTGEATGMGCGPGGGCLVTTPTYRRTEKGRRLRDERTARRLFLGAFRTVFGLTPEQASGLEIGRYDAPPADWERLFAWLATRISCSSCGGLGRGPMISTGRLDEDGEEETRPLPCPGGCVDGSSPCFELRVAVRRDGVSAAEPPAALAWAVERLGLRAEYERLRAEAWARMGFAGKPRLLTGREAPLGPKRSV
jgi:hypothetical protein